MTIELQSRRDFTLAAYEAAAWQGREVRFGAAALARMADCRAQFLRLLDSDPDITIYGVTSGYGHRADRRFDAQERQRHALQPPVGPAAAFGPPLPQRVVRGIVFARLANFVEGHAAVSPDLAAAVAGLLEGGPLPPVPAMGQGGAGEISALAPLFLELAGRFRLGEKEALALINGSPCATALVADAVLATERRLALTEEVLALSAEAVRAPLEAYAPELAGLWNDPHEAAALDSLRSLLAGGGAERRPYQAPVSWRILPRVLGQFRRALAQAREVAERSLSAVTDNPVFLPADEGHRQGRVYSTGGYHNAAAYPALDNLSAAAADLCLIADRHTSKLLEGRHSLLPDQLQAGEGRLGILGFVQVGYGEEARRAAQRTFLPGSEGGGFGQNDIAAPTFLAWRGHDTAGRCLEAALACLAVVASQALFVTGREAPPALRGLLAEVRSVVPPMVDPRPVGSEVGGLAERFRGRVYAVPEGLAEG